ncbi:FAS1-like dehydratase domain-containing protein [Kutzneria sp. CA-103260]|uniref:FAS1-like dehydratase domain-containing protein n=1 Tax=Kutzneria sp. CA-103260 TaxID=2802641 RepID=UPI001BA566A5|nr:MaoC family dehydratase N-terminal domain-containing protein [Kutzneria sp. CA-103260]QUQ63926.1 MaoC like domain-containing protein [Kutzneria sp. CA-103260]
MAETTELLLPGPAQGLGALLAVPVPDLVGGQGLPLLWHWIYLLDRPAQADLGPDGHPRRATTLRGRRMWAGGRVRTLGTLHCGEPATRRSKVLSVQDKQGRSGPLTFVVVEQQIVQSGQVVVDEQQDLVYRDATGSITVADEGPIVPAADDEWQIDVTPTLLFRFSALTYNAHRIHYDRDYARDIEGYPGLLTHGPLQALAMAEAARALGWSGPTVFEYRLLAPLFDHQGMVVRAVPEADSVTTAVRDIHGRPTAIGTLRRP